MRGKNVYDFASGKQAPKIAPDRNKLGIMLFVMESYCLIVFHDPKIAYPKC